MHIKKKLGEGAFANVFLVIYKNEYAALKIPKNNISKKKSYDYSINEINILNNFKTSEYIVNLIFSKVDKTVNHICVELLGDELYSVIKLYKDNNMQMPINIVKRFTKQLLMGMHEMALCNILHNDLKPENILFTKSLGNIFQYSKRKMIRLITDAHSVMYNEHYTKYYYVLQELILSKSHVKISDFGNAYSNKKSKDYESARPTRYYISPEILLKSPYWIKSDMWSIGCIIYEMLTGSILFKPTRENNMGINSAHLAWMIQIFGNFTELNLQHAKKRCRYFNSTLHKFNYLIKKNNIFLYLLQSYNLTRLERDFLSPIFNYNPDKRNTALQCLQSPWLKNI